MITVIIVMTRYYVHSRNDTNTERQPTLLWSYQAVIIIPMSKVKTFLSFWDRCISHWTELGHYVKYFLTGIYNPIKGVGCLFIGGGGARKWKQSFVKCKKGVAKLTRCFTCTEFNLCFTQKMSTFQSGVSIIGMKYFFYSLISIKYINKFPSQLISSFSEITFTSSLFDLSLLVLTVIQVLSWLTAQSGHIVVTGRSHQNYNVRIPPLITRKANTLLRYDRHVSVGMLWITNLAQSAVKRRN